jgi:hypothetical protein
MKTTEAETVHLKSKSMARFISISLVVAVICNTLIFAQKHGPIPIRMLEKEIAMNATPWMSSELVKTTGEDHTTAVAMHVYHNTSSHYLVLEVLGASKVMAFQLINEEGKEIYSGAIRGTQLVETESWPAGTYYFLCGTKREQIDISH